MTQVKVLMVGMPFCTVCKELQPEVSDYCEKNGIPFEYKMLNGLEDKYTRMIISAKRSHAPIILALSSDDDLLGIYEGNSSFKELKDLMIDCMQVTLDEIM